MNKTLIRGPAGVFVLLCAAWTTPAWALTNTNCSTAIALTNNAVYSESTVGVGSNGNPTTICGSGFGNGVWFTVTPTNICRVNISTCGSSFATSLAVYTNTCGALVPLVDFNAQTVCSAANNPFNCGNGSTAGVTFNGLSNVTYYVLAGGYGAQSGLLQIMANMPPPPPNDTCASAIPLSNNIPYTMYNTNAMELGEPATLCGGYGFGRGVWFTVTPTNASRVNLTTCGSSFATSLAVYTNTCGAMVPLVDYNGQTVWSCAGNPFNCGNGSTAGVTFNGLSNVTYYVLAGGYGAQSGLLQIMANMPPPPSNDTCVGAIPLTNNLPYTMYNTNAMELGEPATLCGGYGFGRGVWFTVTPTNFSRVNITTCGSSFATSLAVYTNTCGALVPLVDSGQTVCSAANNPFNCGTGNNAGVSFNGQSNLTYYVLAGGYGAQSGLLEITANVPPPTNDTCGGAVMMTPGTLYTVPTFYATESGDPVPTNCVPSLRGGVWYAYQPQASGPVGVTTCGSDFDTVLAVYTGSCSSGFTNVTCSHSPGALCGDRASLVFNGTAGTLYYILAGGNNGAVGNLRILIPIVDLVSTGLMATNSTGGTLTAGRNFNASWTVQNQGANSLTGTWTDSLSLSNSNTNLVLGSFNSVHSAPAGGSYAEALSGVVLPQIPAGNYTLVAQADAGGVVVESNKVNNIQLLPVTVTSLPPMISLLVPTNQVNRETCVPVVVALAAQVQPGSYTVTNVVFYDGRLSNLIGQRSVAPYSSVSTVLGIGSHSIGAQATDNYGLTGFSTNTAVVFLYYPTNLNVLRADLALNGDFVGCMCASNTTWLVLSSTNLADVNAWLPYATNSVTGDLLAFTNHPSLPRRFFRARVGP